MVNTVLQMLKEHPKYHKNIKDAAESQQSIILNYHIKKNNYDSVKTVRSSIQLMESFKMEFSPSEF